MSACPHRKAFQVLAFAGLAKSNSDARRIIAQGGMYLGTPRDQRKRVIDPFLIITGESATVWRGGKRVVQVRFSADARAI